MPCREPGTARCARENRRQPASAAPSSPHHSRVSAIAPARPGRACASPACLRRALVLGMDTCRTPRHLSRRPGIGLYGGGMSSWWHRDMIAPGKLPLMLCFLAFVVTFVVTRTITRMIRDGRGPFRNRVTASGTHIHHSVPGIILLIIGAFTAVGGPDSLGWRSFAAVAVGIGTSLVLDEFALILHLQDVYWSGEGQLSVEAVSLTAACLGLALVGFSPFADGVLAVICVLKGKYRTALFGLFALPAGLFGAVRLARPSSIWARYRYRGQRLERATRRAADFDRRWAPLLTG